MIDAIREGKAPEVVRRKGAEGSLPVPLDEKIEILVLLCADDNETIRTTAFTALQSWDSQELRRVLVNPAAPAMVLDFAVGYLAPGRKEVQEALLENPQLPQELREWMKNLQVRPEGDAAQITVPPPAAAPQETAAGEVPQDEKRQTLIQKISQMSTVEKIKAALTGSQEERLLLVRDGNKIVARAVLQSPKLSDQEVENIASMKNVSEEVLRLVSMNGRFMKSYVVARTLVNNPRAPIDVTVPLVGRLNERDQKGLSLNKNVPEVLRSMAVKLIRQKQEAQKVKIPTRR